MAKPQYNKLYIAFGGLIILLIATMAFAFVDLGTANTWIALSIAILKTLLVVFIFMGLTGSTSALQLAAGAGVLWLSFAVFLTMADYATRGWNETQPKFLSNATTISSYDRINFESNGKR